MPSKTLIASAEKPAPPVTFDLQPAAVVRRALAHRVDGVDDRVGLAVALDLRDDERRVAVARERRLAAERRASPELLAVEARAVARDDRAVGGRQPAVAAIDDDQRRELAALQALGDLERLGRLGVAGQERGRLVLLRVGELAREVRARSRRRRRRARPARRPTWPGGRRRRRRASPCAGCSSASGGAVVGASSSSSSAGSVTGGGRRSARRRRPSALPSTGARPSSSGDAAASRPSPPASTTCGRNAPRTTRASSRVSSPTSATSRTRREVEVQRLQEVAEAPAGGAGRARRRAAGRRSAWRS